MRQHRLLYVLIILAALSFGWQTLAQDDTPPTESPPALSTEDAPTALLTDEPPVQIATEDATLIPTAEATLLPTAEATVVPTEDVIVIPTEDVTPAPSPTPDSLVTVFSTNFDTPAPDLTVGTGWTSITLEDGLAIQSGPDNTRIEYNTAYLESALRIRVLFGSGTLRLTLRENRTETGTSSYSALLTSDGTLTLFRDKEVLATTVVNIVAGEWVTLELRAIGSDISVTSNDAVLSSIDLSPLPSGGISLSTEPDSMLRIDDMMILAQGEGTLIVPSVTPSAPVINTPIPSTPIPETPIPTDPAPSAPLAPLPMATPVGTGPTITSPTTGTMTNITSPSVNWAPVAGAVSYTLQIATNNTFTANLQTFSSITTVPYNSLPSLDEGVYFVRVQTHKAASFTNFGPIVSFTVDTTPPTMSITPVTPANLSRVNTLRPTFTWPLITGATKYQVQVDADGTFTDDEGDLYNSPLIAALPTALIKTASFLIPSTGTGADVLPQGTHFYRVIPQDAAGNTSTGPAPVVQFDALLGTSPAVNGVVTTPKPKFDWTGIGGAPTYTLQVSDSSTFGTFVINQAGLTAPTFTPLTDIATAPGGTRYWRVLVDGVLPTDGLYNRVIVNLTPAPLAPVLTAPPALGNDTTPAITWNAVANATAYDIQVDETSTFATTPAFVGSTTSATTIDVAPALSVGTYYVRVRGLNAAGAPGPFSATRTIVIETTPPNAPTLSSTVLNGVVVAAPRPAFAWTARPAAEGVATYQLAVSNTNFTSNLPDYDNRSVAAAAFTGTATVAPLTAPGLYQWKVRAVDKAGNIGPYSTPNIFYFNPTALTAPTIARVEDVPSGVPLTNDATPDVIFTQGTPTTLIGLPTITHDFQFSTLDTFAAANTITVKNVSGLSLDDAEWLANAVTSLPNTAKLLYYVRVQTVFSNGTIKILSPFSAKRTFTLDTTAPIAPTISAPINGVILITPRPTFSWVALLAAQGVASYRLDISTNNFSSNLPLYNNRIVTGTAFAIPAAESALANGLYQWRLSAVDTAGNEGPDSATGVFVINAATLTPPVITSLEGAATAAPNSKNTRPVVAFTTTNAALVGLTQTHEVQFSTLASFAAANTITVKGVSDLSLDNADWLANATTSLPNTAKQLYYVRVQTVYTAGANRIVSPPSAARTFTLDTTAPSAPTLTAPINGVVLTAPRPPFSWVALPVAEGVTGYRLDLSNDNFGTRLANYDNRPVTGTAFAIPAAEPALPNGLYQWRLRAVDAAGNESLNSATGVFLLNTVALTPPVITSLEGAATGVPVSNDTRPEATITTSNPDILVVGLTKTHEVQFSTLATFTPATTITIKGVSDLTLDDANWALISLPNTASQLYHVRAQTVYTDGTNTLVSPFSATRTFTLDTTALATPVVTAPLAGATVNLVRPTITWAKITGAAKYHIYHYPSGYPGTPVELAVVSGVVPATATTVSYVIPAASPALSQGPQTITVLSEDAAGNISAEVPANNKSFTIFIGKLPAAAAVVIPTTPTTPIAFSWEPVAGATSYTLQISTTLDNFAGAQQPALATPTSTSVSVVLPPDTYQWRVLVNGVVLPGTVNRTLNVVSANLPTATLNIPVEGDDMVSLDEDSNGITFTWTAPTVVPAVAVDGTFVQTSNLGTFPPATTITSADLGNVTTYTASANLLPETTKFWRVVTRYGTSGGNLVNSAPRAITIDRTAPLAPVITLPAASAISTNTRQPITWGIVATATSYRVDIANDSGFSSFVSGFADLPVTTASLAPAANLPQNTLFARVRAVDAAGNVGPNSLTRSFGIFIATAPAANLIANDTTPTFTWAAQTSAPTGYTIQVDIDGDFSSVNHSFPAAASPFTVPLGQELPFGAYLWRVVVNGNTNPPGLTRTLIVANPLTAPVLISPANGGFTPDNLP